MKQSSSSVSSFLRPFWQRLFPNLTVFGLVSVILWGTIRAWLVLQANVSGSYQWVSLVFISMIIAPWVFLTRIGRQKIGLVKPKHTYWLLVGLLLGVGSALLMYAIGYRLYGHAETHWFVYLSKSYGSVPANLTSQDRWVYFAIFAGIGMTFSPIGEEIFYRGMIHESWVPRFGEQGASYLDSAAFSLTHIAHFGIVYLAGRWQVLLVPGFLWVLLLFGVCQLFWLARRRSGSILGAIIAHAGFNLAMNYSIFFFIL